MLPKIYQILLFSFTMLILSCSENNPGSHDDYSANDINNTDSVWQEDCEEYNDCETAETDEVDETEGYYSLKISDGYFGGHVEGSVDMTSVMENKDGKKSSGYLIYLHNDNDEQSSIEMINITLLNIGDDSGRMAIGEYTFVTGEPTEGIKQYGVFQFYANDTDLHENINVVKGKVTIHEVNDLVYAITDSVDLVHDVGTATLEVVMHDKIEAKDFNVKGTMRIVTVGKMRNN